MELFFKNQFKNLEKNNIYTLHHKFFDRFIFPILPDDGTTYFVFAFIASFSFAASTYFFIGKYSFFLPILLLIILPLYTSYFSSPNRYKKYTMKIMKQKTKIIQLNQDFTIKKIRLCAKSGWKIIL